MDAKNIGVEDDFREDVVTEMINQFFGEHEIYLVVNRHQSLKLKLAKTDLTLSNKIFSAMMLFNRIGVVKKGRR